MLVTIIILSIFLVILLIAIRNMLIKIEKYEDAVQDQAKYLQNISNIIYEGSKHLNTLDQKGLFQADDELGEFFKQMKEIQKELNQYMLPENYGKEEI